MLSTLAGQRGFGSVDAERPPAAQIKGGSSATYRSRRSGSERVTLPVPPHLRSGQSSDARLEGRPLWCSQAVQQVCKGAGSGLSGLGWVTVRSTLVAMGVAHQPFFTRPRLPPGFAPPRTESWCPIGGGGGLGEEGGLLSPPLGGFLSLMARSYNVTAVTKVTTLTSEAALSARTAKTILSNRASFLWKDSSRFVMRPRSNSLHDRPAS